MQLLNDDWRGDISCFTVVFFQLNPWSSQEIYLLYVILLFKLNMALMGTFGVM